jgi:photosystem I subunit XI
MDFVKPFNGDPQEGHLSTPISDSAIVRAFISNLPINRKGLSPIMRGLEVGMAHGYFLVGPEVVLGTNRDFAADPYLAALLTAVAIVVLGTIGLNAHGLVTKKNAADSPAGTPTLLTSEGWSEFAGGFFIGGTGGALFAYLLLDKFASIDAIFRGLVN